MSDAPKPHSELVDDVREALLRIKQRTEGPDPYVNGLYRDAIDALASLEEQVETLRQLNDRVIAERDSWERECNGLSEQLEAAQTALAPFAKAGKKLIHQGSQGYRNGTYDDQTETYTFRVGDVIAAYKIAGTSDPGDAPQSSAPQSDEPSGARGAPFPATSPMAESYPPPEDVERAGELSRERGWKDIGGQGVVSDPASEPKEVA